MGENESKIESEISSKGKIDVTPNARSVFTNTEQDVIIITKDKLKLELIESKNLFSSKKGCITPLGFLISIILTFITAEFKKVVFSADTWRAFFLFGGISCFFWFFYEFYLLVKNWNKGDIDYFIQNLTKEENKNKK